MDDPNNSSYVPKSPDLSAFEPDPLPVQHQGYRGSISHSIPYTPIDQHPPNKQHHYFPSPQQYHHSPPTFAPEVNYGMPRGLRKKEESEDEWTPHPIAMSTPIKPEASNGLAFAGPSAAQALGDIEVKTKFPVARIKRIMQADDDVGKVAQVTPVVVSKALELFMISLVTKAAAEAKGRSSKRVSSLHLKQAVMKDEQFDFLVNIVSKVPDAPAPAEKHQHDDEHHPGEEKKKRAGGRRKRKGSDEE